MRRGFRNERRRTGRRRFAAPAAALAAAALVCGCGQSAESKAAAHRGAGAPGICAPGAVVAMARTLAVAASSVATATSKGTNAMPQCAFSARRNGKRVAVTVNVDNGPQPYFVLERTIVEASQIFSGQRLSPAPENVAGLGLEAAWFPAETHMEATDGSRLITATIDWPGGAPKREMALAGALTRPYLRTPHGKAAQRLAKGFPSNS
jgi:hypothetical protein